MFDHCSSAEHRLSYSYNLLSNDAQGTKNALIQFAGNIGQDQHAHACSLICAFSGRQHILLYPLIL